MPIYEYICPDCRVILNFFVRNPSAAEKPSCPHCGRGGLERKMSSFSVKTAQKSNTPEPEGPGNGPDDISPAQTRKLERLMAKMEKNIDKIDEHDPRQMGRFLREFGEASGEDLGAEFNEVVGRLEAGEDPEKVEEQLSEMFGETGEGEESAGSPYSPEPYSHDDTLYDL